MDHEYGWNSDGCSHGYTYDYSCGVHYKMVILTPQLQWVIGLHKDRQNFHGLLNIQDASEQ